MVQYLLSCTKDIGHLTVASEWLKGEGQCNVTGRISAITHKTIFNENPFTLKVTIATVQCKSVESESRKNIR